MSGDDFVPVSEVRRMRLEPGDVIVCRFPEMAYMSQDHIAKTRALLRERFEGHEVVVLGPGIDLEVYSPAGEKRGA